MRLTRNARGAYAAGTMRRLQAILFDLDNTLYDAGEGLQGLGDVRIRQWIEARLGLPEEEADALRVRTWRQYGTTARGLETEYGLPQAPFYQETIGRIDPQEHISKNPALATMLAELNADCYVFTNAPAVYASRVLEALGVRERFRGIFDIEHSGWHCKPEPEAYEAALAQLALPPAQVGFVEDNPRNLPPAVRLGMYTVLLDNDEGDAAADLRIATVTDLAAALRRAGVDA
jgi:putative hydrolase of the HAD superfamily